MRDRTTTLDRSIITVRVQDGPVVLYEPHGPVKITHIEIQFDTADEPVRWTAYGELLGVGRGYFVLPGRLEADDRERVETLVADALVKTSLWAYRNANQILNGVTV